MVIINHVVGSHSLVEYLDPLCVSDAEMDLRIISSLETRTYKYIRILFEISYTRTSRLTQFYN